MRELFRDADPTRIEYMRAILDAEGIENHVRNESVAESGLSPIPLPETYPAICVINENDYSRAMAILVRQMQKDSEGIDREKTCSNCGEPNPGNFSSCWNCEHRFS